MPPHKGETHYARGRLSAMETYRDYHSIRTWFYVRWFDENGKPDREDMKHAPDELELCP